MAERIFLREVRLDNIKKTLLFYQNSVGNVSCVVWDAALVLTKYLERRSSLSPGWLKGLKVCELGAGLGCVGITAASYGADVLLTDLPEVVPQLERTSELNRTAWNTSGGNLRSSALNWGMERTALLELVKPIDLLLLSDCVYYEESLTPLLDTMKNLCSEQTEILLCQELRDSEKQKQVWKEFLNKLYDMFTVSKVPLSDMDAQFSSPDILLFKAKKKI